MITTRNASPHLLAAIAPCLLALLKTAIAMVLVKPVTLLPLSITATTMVIKKQLWMTIIMIMDTIRSDGSPQKMMRTTAHAAIIPNPPRRNPVMARNMSVWIMDVYPMIMMFLIMDMITVM